MNYEYLIPEENLRDNWKKLDKKLLNRPLKFTFLRDIEDPQYNQVFYKPFVGYNFYDGFLLGPTVYNQALFKKKWLFTVSPIYGFKSKEFTGGVGFAYEHLPQHSSVYRYRAGFSATRSHYDNDLAFNKITPYVSVNFKRNSLRDAGGRSLLARYVMVDKDLPEGVVNSESYKYNILNFRYGSSQPEIINDLRYFADFQYNEGFSKASVDLRYRKLTNLSTVILTSECIWELFFLTIQRVISLVILLTDPSDYLFDSELSWTIRKFGFLKSGGYYYRRRLQKYF